MASINLAQSGARSNSVEDVSVIDKSLALSVGLVFLAVCLFFGLQAYASSIENKRITTEETIKERLKQLEGESVARIINFQSRSELIGKKANSGEVSPYNTFLLMEKLIMPSVVLVDYSYDEEKNFISIKASTADFKSVAQQVMNFKSDSVLKNAILGNVAKDDKGMINFDIKISL